MSDTENFEFVSADLPTVFVIDDDPAIRMLLERAFVAAGRRVQTFESAPHFLMHYSPGAAGCILVDVEMPMMSGLDLAATLIQDPLSPPVIVITASANVENCRTAFRNGAWDFVKKPIDIRILDELVTAAIEFDTHLRRTRADSIRFADRLRNLTERELEVIAGLAQGQKIKQIAKTLGVGFQTVSKQGIRALAKLEVENEIELALRLYRLDDVRSERRPVPSSPLSRIAPAGTERIVVPKRS